MSFLSGSDLLDEGTASGGGTGGSLRVPLVDEAMLSDEGLRSHLKVLGRAESRLAAMKSRALAELSRRHSKGDAQRLVRDELQASKREAKRDVETATRLSELPTTSEALESGEIPVGHAQLIARASGESPIDESVLVEAAGEQPFDEFARTVKRHQQDVADDDGQSLLDRQRSKRKARIFESSDSGMFVLSGEFDQITGARIATALTAKERQLWHREDPNKRATPQQRMADALAELICEPASGRSAGTDLLVIADFDVLKQQLDDPRLADGSPIPIVELHRLALEANLLPSIFDTKAQDMWLGRRQRTASEAQRVALIARDQHCIGCGANPLWCRAHHIIWWSKNGPTDLDNLVLVCDDCHHKIHDHGWQVYKHPKTGKFQLKPPANPSGEPTSSPSRECSAVSSGECSANPSGEPSSGPSGECSAVSSGESSRISSGEFPAVSSGEPSSGPSGECSAVSSGESSRISSDEFPAVSSGESSRISSDEFPAVSSGEVSAVSSGRADRARTRADSAQPVASDATQPTSQNAPGIAYGEEVQRENQSSSDTEKQRPAARSTGHDPVDGIDTS